MSKLEELERRLFTLESEIRDLKAQASATKPVSRQWYAEITGTFKDDPVFDEIVRLGREYRKALRPKTRRKVKR